jgi:ArsR family transcriptional regulator
MSKPLPKLELFASFAAVAKAAAHPNRLDLLEHIAQGERSVDALATVSGLSVANASQHLLQMRRGGLVVSRRDGKRILYRLSSDRVLDFLAALRGIAERNVAEAQQTIATYFTSRDSMEPLATVDLARALKNKSVVLLDVRPESEYALGHIRGAVNIPLKDLERKLRALPRKKRSSRTVVAPIASCRSSGRHIAKARLFGAPPRRWAYQSMRPQDCPSQSASRELGPTDHDCKAHLPGSQRDDAGASEVVDAMLPFLTEHFGNPSSAHAYGRKARESIERARGEVAALVGCDADEIIFTSGATEASNLAIRGVKNGDRRRVVTSVIEHPATLGAVSSLAGLGHQVVRLGVDASGQISTRELVAEDQRIHSARDACAFERRNRSSAAVREAGDGSAPRLSTDAHRRSAVRRARCRSMSG